MEVNFATREGVSAENLKVLDKLASLAHKVNDVMDYSASGNLESPYDSDGLCGQFVIHLWNQNKPRWNHVVSVIDSSSGEGVKEEYLDILITSKLYWLIENEVLITQTQILESPSNAKLKRKLEQLHKLKTKFAKATGVGDVFLLL